MFVSRSLKLLHLYDSAFVNKLEMVVTVIVSVQSLFEVKCNVIVQCLLIKHSVCFKIVAFV